MRRDKLKYLSRGVWVFGSHAEGRARRERGTKKQLHAVLTWGTFEGGEREPRRAVWKKKHRKTLAISYLPTVLARCSGSAAQSRSDCLARKWPNASQTLSRRPDSRADNRRQERKNWRSQGGSTPKATWSPTSEYVFACRTGAPVSVHSGSMALQPGKVEKQEEWSETTLCPGGRRRSAARLPLEQWMNRVLLPSTCPWADACLPVCSELIEY